MCAPGTNTVSLLPPAIRPIRAERPAANESPRIWACVERWACAKRRPGADHWLVPAAFTAASDLTLSLHKSTLGNYSEYTRYLRLPLTFERSSC